MQEASVETERLCLIQKMQERRVIELLRERQYAAFVEDQKKAQEHEIEENVMSRMRTA